MSMQACVALQPSLCRPRLPACLLLQGMLLPLGALNAHHNTANTFLFHPDYGYLLGAGSDPLHV